MASSEEEVSSGQAREEAASDDVEPPVASETPPETEDGAPDSDSEEGAGAGLELRNVLARRRRKSMEDGSTSSPRFRPRNEAEEQGKGGGELMGRLQAQRRRSKAGEAFNSVRDFYSREEAERLSSAAQEIEHVGQAPSATVPTPSRRPSYSSVDALYNQRVQRELTPAYALTRLPGPEAHTRLFYQWVRLDRSMKGQVSEGDFLATARGDMATGQGPASVEHAKALFQLMDIEGKGYVDVYDFLFLEALGELEGGRHLRRLKFELAFRVRQQPVPDVLGVLDLPDCRVQRPR